MFASGNIIAGKYRLSHLLGEGGMGAVWAAKNEAIARDVAIKVMRPQIAEDPVALQRFFTEAQICGSIRNPGIVDVLDLGRAEDDSPFLVMELLEGESLEAMVDRDRHILPSVILPIVRDVARTIALAHQKGVIHRDLKPGNLFLHRSSPSQTVVKVLDFGISKVLTPGYSARTTATGTTIGSPAYMSPEQALGRVAVDNRTDIYALGVILYEALSGRLPFQDENYNAVIVSVVTSAPPDISALTPGLPPKIAALVRAAMEKDRDKRIATMAELADRIETLLPGVAEADRSVLAEMSKLPPEKKPPIKRSTTLEEEVSTQSASMATTVVTPRRRRWLPVALGVIAVAVAAGLFLSLHKPGPGQPIAAQDFTAVTAASVAAPLPLPPPVSAALPIEEPALSASSSRALPSSSQTGPRPPGSGGAGLKKKDGGAWGYD